jgi:hypothetical protein
MLSAGVHGWVVVDGRGEEEGGLLERNYSHSAVSPKKLMADDPVAFCRD